MKINDVIEMRYNNEYYTGKIVGVKAEYYNILWTDKVISREPKSWVKPCKNKKRIHQTKLKLSNGNNI